MDNNQPIRLVAAAADVSAQDRRDVRALASLPAGHGHMWVTNGFHRLISPEPLSAQRSTCAEVRSGTERGFPHLFRWLDGPE